MRKSCWAATDENTRLLFLCSPNNPSGNCFPKKEIEKVIRRFNGIVILDEAYIDFAGQPGFLSELDEYPNLVILQTLSKAWGMAASGSVGFRTTADRRYAEAA